MPKKLALAMGLAFAIAATSANAESISIKTSDLDLSTEAGMKKLDERIAAAARKVCGASEHTTGSRLRTASVKECVKQASAAAREQFAAKKALAKG